MAVDAGNSKIYDGEGDRLMQDFSMAEHLVLLPDARPAKRADTSPHIRMQWGQHLLDDLVAGRYRTFVCAVNAEDNSRGIITQLADLLPTSQWNDKTITQYARQFVQPDSSTVVKIDMDMVEVLALLRPAQHDHMTLEDLSHGFRVAGEMIRRKPQRMPVASVCFLGGKSNRLADGTGSEPTFETVLRTMYDAGFSGDVYPALWMWESAPTGVFARYPFPSSLENMREGGF